MISLGDNLRLAAILAADNRFALGVELVSTRGMMTQQQALKARAFADELTASPRVDWVSITDNAGGNPQLAPIALGTPILYGGKEVIIHLTCKDLNRHALESQLWLLASQGFHNILAMTGDYPLESFGGRAKPVFDIDSVALLAMIRRLNAGLEVQHGAKKTARRLDATHFFAGAVTNNFKLDESALLPQYYKLDKKLAAGAQFIINQIGYDARQCSELPAYLRRRQTPVPLVGNVFVLNGTVARLFHERAIPGVVLSDGLHELCQRQAASADKGRVFFRELAAKQMAIYRGLGYRGAYLGGVHDYGEVSAILDLQASFGANDWLGFVRELHFPRPGQFYLFEEDPATGLAQPELVNQAWAKSMAERPDSPQVTLFYRLAKACHGLMFVKGQGLAPLGARLCAKAHDPRQGPAWMRLIERSAKGLMHECRDCGDCSLAETAFLCPESQCAKNQRNGPCGGSRDGQCEVFDYDCIWSRAYDRLKHEGRAEHLLDHAPVVQNQGLRGTSAWANFWLARDHQARPTSERPPP